MAANVDRRARAVGAAHGVLRRGPQSATGSRIVLDTGVTRMIPRCSLSAISDQDSAVRFQAGFRGAARGNRLNSCLARASLAALDYLTSGGPPTSCARR